MHRFRVGDAIDHVHVRARSVVFVFAGRVCWIGAGLCGPLPDPVEGKCFACFGRRWDLEVCFAPQRHFRCRLPWVRVWEFLLSLRGEGAGVEFVASSVVKGLRCEERTAFVAAGAVGRPF